MVWLGEGDGRFPEVLRPPGARAADDAVIFSEACYGATLAEGGGSIAPAFLAAGARVFVGSTIIAWGAGRGGAPCLADELAARFFLALDRGLPPGAALEEARLAMLEAALASGGGLSAPLHNTLLSFTLYGHPGLARPAHGAAGIAAARATESKSALADARDRLRRRLSPDAWAVVSSGRSTLEAVAAGLRDGDTVTRRLTELLGTAPAHAHVVRYAATKARAAERSTVFAETAGGRFARRAGVDLDADGRVTLAFVSR
jgi:hypothetical protein